MHAPKVTFLIIGAQKAGTTALDHCLRQHPQVGMAGVKEVHYFDDDGRFAAEPGDHGAYEAQFPGERVAHGEATPIYLYWEPCCARIQRYNPAMRIVAVLRDPVRRAYSQWNMEFNRGDELCDVEAAFAAEMAFHQQHPGAQHRVRSYLARGFYSTQVERYQRHFDAEQLLWLRYDDLLNDPQGTLERVHRHIGVDPGQGAVGLPTLNRGAYAAPLDPVLEGRLRRMFAGDIRRTAQLTGLDLQAWLGSAG